ncbi:hypothetical protein [Sinorhizobium meliloti]|uniref:hypothetical protein n=1 Tax=Rhizobium meliloti TaxID=382 RepID=UPI001F377C6C|nr:hypothetical protein [Sinorhizobium meliloti]
MPKSTEVLPECTQLMDPGKLRPFLEAFTSRLLNLGHTRLTVSGYEALTMALRGYLKYLATQGLCQPGLDQAIPTVPQWRLSALPLYISTADVDRVVASCDGHDTDRHPRSRGSAAARTSRPARRRRFEHVP